MKNRSKLRPLWILLSAAAGTAAVLVLLASLGVFRNYRYDDSGFTVGGGSVEGTVRKIEIDWLNGPIRIELSEDDRYLSVSEYAAGELGTQEQLRWKLDADGTLTVRARASVGFLLRTPEAKVLVIRIPSALAGELAGLSIRTRSRADIALSLLPDETTLTADQSGTKLTLPEDAGFTLRCRGVTPTPVGPAWEERDGSYVRLDGRAALTVSGRGELLVYTKKSAE